LQQDGKTMTAANGDANPPGFNLSHCKAENGSFYF